MNKLPGKGNKLESNIESGLKQLPGNREELDNPAYPQGADHYDELLRHLAQLIVNSYLRENGYE